MLDVQGDRALVITKDIIEQRPYNVESIEVTWEICTLRKYLNDEFLQKFPKEDQVRIAETKINNPDNLWYGTKGGNYTTDKVFLLSLEEADKYFGDSGDYMNKRRKNYNAYNGKIASSNNGQAFSNTNDSYRIARYDNGVSYWWLRSPGKNDRNAAYVNAGGAVFVDGDNKTNDNAGVRPALWLKL